MELAAQFRALMLPVLQRNPHLSKSAKKLLLGRLLHITCAGKNRDTVRHTMTQLAGLPSGEGATTQHKHEMSEQVNGLLIHLLALLDGAEHSDGLDQEQLLSRTLKQLELFHEHLLLLADRKRYHQHSMSQLLQLVASRLHGNEAALEKAANETFDRILHSVDPRSVEQSVEKSTMKPAAFYKADLFDAMTEKHSQLLNYHQKGRLMRDFRGTYRSELRRALKKEAAT